MNTSPEQLYLDLLKKTLSYALWKEHGIPWDPFLYKVPQPLRTLLRAAIVTLRTVGLELQRTVNYTEEQRKEGLVWPVHADTMIGLKRLDNIQFCVERVLQDKVPGDLIETGVWRGGACIFMRAILAAYQVHDRRVFVADSFAGLPKPDAAKYPADKGDPLHQQDYLAVSQEQVAENFRKYGLLDDQVVFLKGWFRDTLPQAPIQRLAVLRLDGDMYESTMDALGSLYHKLSPGGYCIIDDYQLVTCYKAITDFRAERKIQEPLVTIDSQSVYWRKQ